ncbi:MAG: phosphate starvation-inducible protein PhoH, partial [Lawsonibacter sp.]|nr:phosphate starvation-inducible protein PhoH [Lawsonibacter sp.]
MERMEEAINLFGLFDENIRIIEQELGVAVVNRESNLKITGEGENVMLAVKAVQGLLSLSARGEAIGQQNVRYIIELVRSGNEG